MIVGSEEIVDVVNRVVGGATDDEKGKIRASRVDNDKREWDNNMKKLIIVGILVEGGEWWM